MLWFGALTGTRQQTLPCGQLTIHPNSFGLTARPFTRETRSCVQQGGAPLGSTLMETGDMAVVLCQVGKLPGGPSSRAWFGSSPLPDRPPRSTATAKTWLTGPSAWVTPGPCPSRRIWSKGLWRTSGPSSVTCFSTPLPSGHPRWRRQRPLLGRQCPRGRIGAGSSCGARPSRCCRPEPARRRRACSARHVCRCAHPTRTRGACPRGTSRWHSLQKAAAQTTRRAPAF